MTEHITVSVDPDVAEVYRSASDDDRRKLDLLIQPALARGDGVQKPAAHGPAGNQPRRTPPWPDPGNPAIHPRLMSVTPRVTRRSGRVEPVPSVELRRRTRT